MNEYEDRQLASRLGRLGGDQPDDNVAYAAVLGKVRRARRRRAVALTGGSMLGLALLATAVAVNTGRSDRSLRPATQHGSVDDTVDGSRPANTGTLGTDSTALSTDGSVVTTLDTTATSVGSDSTASESTSPSTIDQTPAPSPSTPPPSSPPSTPSPTPPPTPAATTRTFSGVGGSITVRLQDGQLSLVGTAATGGFTVQVAQGSGQRVEVLFRSDDHETRIRVDVSAGAMDPDVDENDDADGGEDDDDGSGSGSGSDDTGPDDTDD
jgi:hypothetical protein